ncbi:hypothetical protein T03_14690 [Trichinella britovi]|uniref:Uncharacterized protein n=1 Tax=Trichinella britovi TaxID=45882 RepID=A0A0V1AI39_TRIBR|nr:hypothetical protein T03_14690 [Trichinella britovi]
MPGIIRILSITLSKTCNLSTSVSLRFSRKKTAESRVHHQVKGRAEEVAESQLAEVADLG